MRGSDDRFRTCCRNSTSTAPKVRSASAVPASSTDPKREVLLGYAGVLMGGERDELRPSRTGSLFLAYDLKRYKAEARALVNRQSLYWSGWVTALALAMWLVFHFLLTRRTARLVRAAEQLAAGNLAVRSNLKGRDELGKLSVAFDAMALDVAETQRRLRQDIEARARVQRELENSEARLQQILNNATAVVFVKDTEGRYLFVNRQWERLFHVRQADVVGKSDSEVLPEARRQDLSRQRSARPAAQCADGVRGDRAARRRRAHVHLDQVPAARRERRCLRGMRDLHRHHREEALRGRARAAARIAVSARKAGGAGLAARGRRPRAQQSAFGRRRARGAARGAGRRVHAGRRRSRSAPPPSAARASCGPSSRWPGSSSRSAVPWRSTT